jgi:hypothetical protein
MRQGWFYYLVFSEGNLISAMFLSLSLFIMREGHAAANFNVRKKSHLLKTQTIKIQQLSNKFKWSNLVLFLCKNKKDT